MSIVMKAVEETKKALIDQRMVNNFVLELPKLRSRWQIPVEDEVGHFQEVASFGQLLHRVSTVQKNPLVTIDIGDGARARGRGSKARVVSE